MSLKIPNNTKNYLLECLNKHNNSNKDLNSIETLKESTWDDLFGKKKGNKYPAMEGGYGKGGPKDPEEGTGEFDLSDVGDFITDLSGGGLIGLAVGAGAATAGKSKATGLAKKIGGVAGKIGALATPFMVNPLAMAAKLSGADWVREQLKGIALGQEGLVAQGAGSPWVPLRTSGLGILSKGKPNSKKSTP